MELVPGVMAEPPAVLAVLVLVLVVGVELGGVKARPPVRKADEEDEEAEKDDPAV